MKRVLAYEIDTGERLHAQCYFARRERPPVRRTFGTINGTLGSCADCRVSFGAGRRPKDTAHARAAKARWAAGVYAARAAEEKR